ncbi:hypothetical protein ES703_21338 [subsurface metagenome]
MVKEVGHHLKQDWLAGLKALVGNSRRQVGLTTAGNSLEDYPAFGGFSEITG